MKNNGMDYIEYNLTSDINLNQDLSKKINELIHVFKFHNDGKWKSHYKPKYIEMFSILIADRPSLIRKLLALKEPVVSNIVHSAIKEKKSGD